MAESRSFCWLPAREPMSIWTAEERSLTWSLAQMLRKCVLAVFTGTDSSAAISCRGRFAGRYLSTSGVIS